jgi:hypothetical protein
MLRLLRMLVIAVGLLLLAPGAASAGSYLVTSCHDPLGRPNAALGWMAGSTAGALTANSCVANGSLGANLVGAQPSGSATAGWRFTAPPGTHIVRVLARRATRGMAPSREAKDVAYVMETNDQLLESCEPSATTSCVADLTAPLDKQGLNGSYVEFRVLCTNVGRLCTRPIGVDATHAWVSLADEQAPVVVPRMIDDGGRSGTLRVGFDARDVGGGVYRALVKVDGRVARIDALGTAPCADVNPSDGNAYQFDVPVPCPAAVTGAQVAVDARSLPPGPHSVEVAVEDAGGNQAVVLGPTAFPTLNVPPGSSVTPAQALSGRLRMWFVKAPNRGRRHTSRFGTRVVTRGILRTSSGRGIQGARIDVYHIRNGSRRLVKTGLKSRAAGRITLILPLDVDTRTIEYAYRALRPGPITSRQRLRLTVRRNGRVYHRSSSR